MKQSTDAKIFLYSLTNRDKLFSEAVPEFFNKLDRNIKIVTRILSDENNKFINENNTEISKIDLTTEQKEKFDRITNNIKEVFEYEMLAVNNFFTNIKKIVENQAKKDGFVELRTINLLKNEDLFCLIDRAKRNTFGSKSDWGQIYNNDSRIVFEDPTQRYHELLDMCKSATYDAFDLAMTQQKGFKPSTTIEVLTGAVEVLSDFYKNKFEADTAIKYRVVK